MLNKKKDEITPGKNDDKNSSSNQSSCCLLPVIQGKIIWEHIKVKIIKYRKLTFGVQKSVDRVFNYRLL